METAAAMTDPTESILKDEPAITEALNLYAVDANGSPSRSELVVRILRDWLVTNGYLRSDPLEALSDETKRPSR